MYEIKPLTEKYDHLSDNTNINICNRLMLEVLLHLQNLGGIPPPAQAAWPLSSSADMPKINNIQVQCEKTHVRVNIDFDRPFFGVIFSKGHYSDPNCVHLQVSR